MQAISNIPNKRVRARLIAQQSAMARKIVSNTYSVYVLKKTENPQLYTLQGERKRIGRQEAIALNEHSCQWSLSLVLVTRESNGKRKLIFNDTVAPKQCKFDHLINSVADNIIELSNEYPYQDNLITVGWIASHKNEIPEEVAYKIFDELGAWSEL